MRAGCAMGGRVLYRGAAALAVAAFSFCVPAHALEVHRSGRALAGVPTQLVPVPEAPATTLRSHEPSGALTRKLGPNGLRWANTASIKAACGMTANVFCRATRIACQSGSGCGGGTGTSGKGDCMTNLNLTLLNKR